MPGAAPAPCIPAAIPTTAAGSVRAAPAHSLDSVHCSNGHAGTTQPTMPSISQDNKYRRFNTGFGAGPSRRRMRLGGEPHAAGCSLRHSPPLPAAIAPESAAGVAAGTGAGAGAVAARTWSQRAKVSLALVQWPSAATGSRRRQASDSLGAWRR